MSVEIFWKERNNVGYLCVRDVKYGQQHVTLYTCSLILVPLIQEQYKIQVYSLMRCKLCVNNIHDSYGHRVSGSIRDRTKE
jgi:hypothetical protein